MKPDLLILPLILTLIQTPLLAEASPTPRSETNTIPASRPLSPLDGTKQIQLQLVNCQNPIDCWLTDRLLPRSSTITSRQLQFANQNATAINILNTAIVAEGKLTGYQLTPKELQLPSTQTLTANQISSLLLKLDRSQIPPDHYTGNLYLILDQQSEWITLPINLSVRTGPFLPLLVLLWGILLGRLLKYMQERGEPQAKVLQDLNELEYELRSLDPSDQASLTPVITQARQSAYREQFEVANTKIKLIRDRLEVLTNLRTLENQLEQRIEPIPDDTVNHAIETLQTARKALIKGEDNSARAGIQEVSELLDRSGTKGNDSSQTRASVQGVTDSLDKLGEHNNSAIAIQSPSFGHWLRRSVIGISGVSDRARAEATFWIVRPLLGLVLLGGLSAMGLGSLYIEKGETFGARPFSDYLGLILWGLSADVASRSLSSLSERSGQKES